MMRKTSRLSHDAATSNERDVTTMYELDDYESQRISLQKGAQLSLPEGSSTSEESAYAKHSELWADSVENPTQLFLRLHYSLWDLAIKTIEQRPLEAETWIISYKSSGKTKSKILPAHEAVQRQSPPCHLVQKLIAAYPTGLKCRDFEGNLPLHLACKNEPLVREGHEVIILLIEEYPESLFLANSHGRVPLRILQEVGAPNEVLDYVKHRMNNANVFHPYDDSTDAESRHPSDQHDESSENDFASELNQRFMNTSLGSPFQYLGARQTRDSPESTPSQDRHQRSLYLKPSLDATDAWRGEEKESVKRVALQTGHLHGEVSSEDDASGKLNIKLAKCMNENEALHQKLKKLTKEHTATKTVADEKAVLVGDLRQSLQSEREFFQRQLKEQQGKMKHTHKELAESEKLLDATTTRENVLLARVAMLESRLEDKKAESTTLLTALETEEKKKSELVVGTQLIQAELDATRSELSRKSMEIDDSRTSERETAIALINSKEKETSLTKQLDALKGVVTEKDARIRDLTSETTSLKNDQDELMRSFDNKLVSREKTIKNNTLEKEKLEKDIIELLARLESNQQLLKERELANQKISMELSKKTDEVTVLASENERCHTEIEKTSECLSETREAGERKSAVLGDLERKIEQLHLELEQRLAEATIESADKSDIITQLELHIKELRVERETLTENAGAERARMTETIQRLEKESEALRDENKELRTSEADLRNENVLLVKMVEEKCSQLTTICADNTELSAEVTRTESERQTLSVKVDKLLGELLDAQNRLDVEETALAETRRECECLSAQRIEHENEKCRSEGLDKENKSLRDTMESIHMKLRAVKEGAAKALEVNLDGALAENVIATMHAEMERLRQKNADLDLKLLGVREAEKSIEEMAVSNGQDLIKIRPLKETSRAENEKSESGKEELHIELQSFTLDNSIVRQDINNMAESLACVQREKSKLESVCVSTSRKMSEILQRLRSAQRGDISPNETNNTDLGCDNVGLGVDSLIGVTQQIEQLVDKLASTRVDLEQNPRESHFEREQESKWLRTVMDTLREFVDSQDASCEIKQDHEAPTKASILELLRKVLEMSHVSAHAMKKKVKKLEARTHEYKQKLEGGSAAWETLVLENKMLKKSERKKEDASRKAHENIVAENELLRRIIRRLTAQTKALQKRFEVLMVRQEALRRKTKTTTNEGLNTENALEKMRETSLVADFIEGIATTESLLAETDRYESLDNPELIVKEF